MDVNNATVPPMGTLSFHDEAISMRGPQNIRRPEKDKTTIKALPTPAISPGQMSLDGIDRPSIERLKVDMNKYSLEWVSFKSAQA